MAKQCNGPRRGNSKYILYPLYSVIDNKKIQVVFNAKVIPGPLAEVILREMVYNAWKILLFVIINLTQPSSSRIVVKHKSRGQNYEERFLFQVFFVLVNHGYSALRLGS